METIPLKKPTTKESRKADYRLPWYTCMGLFFIANERFRDWWEDWGDEAATLLSHYDKDCKLLTDPANNDDWWSNEKKESKRYFIERYLENGADQKVSIAVFQTEGVDIRVYPEYEYEVGVQISVQKMESRNKIAADIFRKLRAKMKDYPKRRKFVVGGGMFSTNLFLNLGIYF